jgi:chromosome segregation ATPase
MVDFLKNYKYLIALIIILITGIFLPVTKDTSKELRTEVDNLTYMVDLVNFDNAQIKTKIDTSLGYSANLTSKISSDFYVKLNSYDGKIKSLQDTIDYTLNRLAVIDESMADINGVESFNNFVTTLNTLSHEITLLKTELNSIKASIDSLDTRLKKLE